MLALVEIVRTLTPSQRAGRDVLPEPLPSIAVVQEAFARRVAALGAKTQHVIAAEPPDGRTTRTVRAACKGWPAWAGWAGATKDMISASGEWAYAAVPNWRVGCLASSGRRRQEAEPSLTSHRRRRGTWLPGITRQRAKRRLGRPGWSLSTPGQGRTKRHPSRNFKACA